MSMIPQGIPIPADAVQEIAERERYTGPPTETDRLIDRILDGVRQRVFTVVRPAHIDPPFWSNPLDLSARVTVPAAAGAYATAIQYIVQPGWAAAVAAYGVNVLDAAYTYDGSILWRLRRGDRNLSEGLADWAIQRGSVIQPRRLLMPVILDGDKESGPNTFTFEVRRAVAAGAPQDVDHCLLGWIWRKRNTYEGTALVSTS